MKDQIYTVGGLLAKQASEMPPCRACGKRFVKGERAVLVPLGPGDDQEERDKMYQGKHYLSVAIPVHWDCAAKEYLR